MKVKNQQDRTNAILRFAGIAIIPLVVLFISGFAAGRTSKIERQNYKAMYEKIMVDKLALEEKIASYENFSEAVGILTEKMFSRDAVRNLHNDMDEAFDENDDEMKRSVRDDYKKHLDKAHDDFTDLKLKYPSEDSVFINWSLLFETLAQKQDDVRMFREKFKLCQSQRNDGLDCESEIEKLQNDLNQKDQDLAKKDDELRDLNYELKRCKDQHGETSTAMVSVKTVAGDIETGVEDIQTNVIPKIKKGLINQNQQELELLKAKLVIISQKAASLK